MSRAEHDELVPRDHPEREALLALAADLEALPADGWATIEVPAIAPPPEIVSAPSAPVPSRFARYRVRALGGVVAAAAAAVVAVTVLGDVRDPQAPAPVALRAVEPGSSAAGRVVVADDGVRVAMTGLEPIGAGQHYEAWSLADPDRPRSLGVVRPDGSGAASLDADLEDPASPVAVTREPDDADPAPSGAFVLRSS